jgi:hypothetical protein
MKHDVIIKLKSYELIDSFQNNNLKYNNLINHFI